MLAIAEGYTPVLILILVAIGLVVVIQVLAHVIGPRRHGERKESTYESGMPIVGDARGRFNVRFYIVAMLFLLFDVEVVFVWPWVKLYYAAATTGQALDSALGVPVDKTYLLAGMGLFLLLLVVGYVYDWKKGVFRLT